MFSRDVLRIDAPALAERIEKRIQEQVLGTLRRHGAVVGLSGGIDSAVVATLSARALGTARVVGLLLLERDSPGESLRLGQMLAAGLGIRFIVEDITSALAAHGCYARQVEAIRMVVPDYREGWRCKLTLPSLLNGDRLAITYLTVTDSAGKERTVRMPPAAYEQLLSATSFKQRCRKTKEYCHADRLDYAVAGTPDPLQYDQGSFMKQGDGTAELKPSAHLYKTQLYALAEHLGVPEEIRNRLPASDTFSLPELQEEFHFALPYEEMDLCLWAHDHHQAPAEVAAVLGFTRAQVERIYGDIDARRRASRYLHSAPPVATTAGA
jgi:NAD+ synthase